MFKNSFLKNLLARNAVIFKEALFGSVESSMFNS